MATGSPCRRLHVPAALHGTTWSTAANDYVADPYNFTVRVDNWVTVHVYVKRDQAILTEESKVDRVTTEP